MALTLAQKPGWSDFPNARLASGQFARGSAFAAALDNTKFGAVRLEFFYGNYVDGDTVPLPVSGADGYKYKASELIYLWTYRLTANPKDGKTGGPGTILQFVSRVEQSDDTDPGLVHSKVVYHVQGSETTETEDGTLGVTTLAIRGRDELTAATAPTWNNQADTEYDLDSVLKTERATRLNDNAKLAVLQTEIFDMGEFGDAETVPLKVSPIDGYAYAYSEMTFLTSWRITAAKATGITSGAAGETLSRLRASINSATGVVDLQVDYRFPRDSSGGMNTSDGIVRVVAICVRSGLTVTGSVTFDDLDDKAFFSGVILGDDDIIKINQNSKFSALRPEIFVTAETDGDIVPLPVSAIDGYIYVRAECFYIWTRDDTGAPAVGGSLLTLHGFIRQDTGAVKNKLFFHRQGGSGSTQVHGGFRCITVAMRTKDVEVDADGGAAGGGGDGFGGGINAILRNPSYEHWTHGTNQIIADDWGKWQQVGDSTFAQQTGLAGIFAQGLIVSTAGAGNHAGVQSVPIQVFRRIRYGWTIIAKSTVSTTKGFFMRVHLYDSAVSESGSFRFFDLLENVSLGINIKQFNNFFTMPQNGDANVTTPLGEKIIKNQAGAPAALNFDPLFIRIVLINFEPNVASTFIVDLNNWIDLRLFDPSRPREPGRDPLGPNRLLNASFEEGTAEGDPSGRFWRQTNTPELR